MTAAFAEMRAKNHGDACVQSCPTCLARDIQAAKAGWKWRVAQVVKRWRNEAGQGRERDAYVRVLELLEKTP